MAYRQGKLFTKFKESEKLEEILQEIEVSKSTVGFNVKLVKILDKYPILKMPSASFNFSKGYFKTMAAVSFNKFLYLILT